MSILFRLVLFLIIVLSHDEAYALGASAPISASNGVISCPTCTTSASNYTTNSVIYGTGSGKATAGVTVNGTATKKYLQQVSSGAPTMEQIAIGDLGTFSSSDLAGRLSDESGTGGTVVYSTEPSISNITLTGTVTLPSGAVDAIGEIATGIKSGGVNAAKVVTTTSSALTANNCAKWDSDGNLIDAGTTCGGTSITPLTSFSSLTPVTVTTTQAVYLSLAGDVSTTESEVQTPIKNASTLGNLQCVANAGTTSAITAVVGTGACGSTINYTSKAQVIMSTSANTTGTSSGTTSVTAGNCAVVKLTVSTTDADAASVHCSLERTA